MGFYSKHILPHIIDCACSSGPIMRQREKVVPFAKGDVLEVGCGSGTNFGLYDTSNVRKVFALEPDEAMIRKARKRDDTFSGLDVEFLLAGGEDVPLENHTVDSVVFTFTLCTIPDWKGSLHEAKRVLRPGGQLYFCEHGGAPDPNVAKWQSRLEPLQKTLAGGCHLTRVPTKMLEETGFKIGSVDAFYQPKAPKPLAYFYIGQASVA